VRNQVALIAVLATLPVGCGGPTIEPTEEARAKDLQSVSTMAARFCPTTRWLFQQVTGSFGTMALGQLAAH
jgi:hypothetical protein